MLDIAKLSSNLKPKDNQLFMKIIKGVKDVTEQRICSDDVDNVRAAMPDDVSDLQRCCLKNTNSILKNMPTPKCVTYGHIVNVSAEELCDFFINRITYYYDGS